MPIATKNNAIIIKDGKLAENCECCVSCVLPLPSSIELAITSGETQYASVAFSGGSPARQFASAAAWFIPGGTYVLQPTSPGSGIYSYSNSNIGMDSIDVRFLQNQIGTSIVLALTVSPMRQKTLADTLTPPTQSEMTADNWFLPDAIGDLHPAVDIGIMSYIFHKCTFGEGAANRLTNRWSITESCVNSGLVISRSTSAIGTLVISSHSICSQSGCVAPFALQASQHNVELPRKHPGFFGIPINNAPFFPYASFSGNTRGDDGGYGRVSGKATASIDSITLVYASSSQPLFSSTVASSCSSFSNPGLADYPTLPSSVVPGNC